jgi:hypothetical protein
LNFTNNMDIDDDVDLWIKDTNDFIKNYLMKLEKRSWYKNNKEYYKDAILTFDEIKNHVFELNQIINKFYFYAWKFFIIIFFIFIFIFTIPLFNWWFF